METYVNNSNGSRLWVKRTNAVPSHDSVWITQLLSILQSTRSISEHFTRRAKINVCSVFALHKFASAGTICAALDKTVPSARALRGFETSQKGWGFICREQKLLQTWTSRNSLEVYDFCFSPTGFCPCLSKVSRSNKWCDYRGNISTNSGAKQATNNSNIRIASSDAPHSQVRQPKQCHLVTESCYDNAFLSNGTTVRVFDYICK